MEIKTEFEKAERQIVILVFFNHLTEETHHLKFTGHNACLRATQHRDDTKQKHPGCSSALIWNDVAALAWQNHIVKGFDANAEIDGNIPDPD